MNCEEALELISGHLDGENTEAEEAALRAHLEGCPACRAALDDYGALDLALADLEAEPPAALAQGVLTRAAAEKSAAGRRWRRYGGAALAAAAVIALVLTTSRLPSLQKGRASTVEPAAEPAVQSDVPAPASLLPAEDAESRAYSPAAEFQAADVTFAGGPFFDLPEVTEAQLEALYGPVEAVTFSEAERAEDRRYDGVTVRCAVYEDDDGVHRRLYGMAYTRPEMTLLRGVCVGDSMESALAVYRDDGDRTVQETALGPAAILYGDPAVTECFGLLRYAGGAPAEILYWAGEAGAACTLDGDGLVSQIEILGPLAP